MLERIRQSLHVARPRSISRMQKSIDDLVQGVRGLRLAIKVQGERDKAIELRQERDAGELAKRIGDVDTRIAELTEKIERLLLRESQLRAVATADAALHDACSELPAVCHEEMISAYVREAFARSPLLTQPRPYRVVADGVPPGL